MLSNSRRTTDSHGCDRQRPCFSEAQEALLVPIARDAAATVLGRHLSWPGEVFVPGSTIPDSDPLVEDQVVRALAVLLAAARCSRHRPDVTLGDAVRRRLYTAIVEFLTSDAARRHTTARDLHRAAVTGLRSSQYSALWSRTVQSLRDHGRQLTTGTVHTARPERAGASYTGRGGRRLFTDAGCEIYKILVRGLASGERVAAQALLGLCPDDQAVGYLRRVAVQTYRNPLSGGTSHLVELDDVEVAAQLWVLRDRDTWKEGGEKARRAYAALVLAARELVGTRLDENWDRPDEQRPETQVHDSVFGTDTPPVLDGAGELRLWRSVRDAGYRLGSRVFAADERRRIEARIAELDDLYGDE